MSVCVLGFLYFVRAYSLNIGEVYAVSFLAGIFFRNVIRFVVIFRVVVVVCYEWLGIFEFTNTHRRERIG